MKLHCNYYLFFLLSLLSLRMHAQDDDAAVPLKEALKPLYKQYYVFSPRVSLTVPHPLANRAFKKSFVGVYEVSGGLNVMLYKGLFIGCTYKNSLFKIMENKIPDYNANMTLNSVAGKIGGDWYISDNNRIVYSMALSGGRNWTYFSKLVCKTPGHTMNTHYSTTYIEPEVNLFFLVEANFGIGVTLAYTIFNRNFDPYEICLDDWSSFEKSNPGQTQYFSFGFGFYYNFLKKKKTR